MADNADILKNFQELQDIPEGVHWFCPRESEQDTHLYFAEDLANDSESEEQRNQRLEKVEEAKSRQAKVWNAVQIFAFDGKDAEVAQQWMEGCLTKQMRQCDICVREYHRGRSDLKLKLEDAYDAEDVTAFLTVFDDINIRRIEHGLAVATKHLLDLPIEKRGISALDQGGILTVFEVFNCTPFHTDEVKLSLYFDQFFHLVQTNKLLKLSSYSPAMFQFLFGEDRARNFWASGAFQKFKRNLTSQEFEYCAREPFQRALTRVQLSALDKEYLQQFWDGVKQIVNRLDKDLITHSLRALDAGVTESDICRLAFSHLQVDDNAFTSILATVEQILKVSPADFWEAMGTVSATAWIEQFFTSPALARLLDEGRSEPISDSPYFDMLFSWALALLQSIKPANRTQLCRRLVDQMMAYSQDIRYSPATKNYCFKFGLRVLDLTLHGLNQTGISKIVGPTTIEAIEVTSQHISKIAPFARKASIMPELASEVFKQAIALDCKCLVTTGRSSQETSDSKGYHGYHATIWKSAGHGLDYGNVMLAKKLVIAVRPLGGTESIVSKKKLGPVQIQFNQDLESANRSITDWLGRIGDFSTRDLQSLFQDSDCIQGIMSLVFSSNKDVGSAAIEIIKTWSGKTTRTEALEYLLRTSFATAITAVTRSLQQIESTKAFTPTANVLRPCSDIMDILCNSQSGLLRSQNLSDTDARATEAFWQALWILLTTIFSSTESWSQVGHDRTALMDFCRATMEFADMVFDQFGVLRGALDQAEAAEPEVSLGMRLIEKPKNATNVITKWLKLRDEILVGKSCALVCKLFIRLKEYDVQLPEETLQFIVDVAMDGTRTTLSQQQKAELLRALETHSGIKFDNKAEPSGPSARKTDRAKKEVIDLTNWTSNANRAVSNTTGNTIAKVQTALTPAHEKFQTMQFASRPVVGLTGPLGGPKMTVAESSAFRKKRELEMAEKKRRDALALAQHKKRLGVNSSLVPGEGSGLRGLGVQGKVHEIEDTKGTGMMVSSDEESDVDADFGDMDKQLFGKSTATDKRNGLTIDQAKAMKRQLQGPVKKQRLVRSTRDMRARLAPDLSALHKSILGWEYFHEGAFPPNLTAQDHSFVLNTFRDPHEYQKTFQPLLILEAWNGFLKAKEENSSKPYPIKVVMRSSVDAFLEVSSTMSHEDGKQIAEGDVVLLSKTKSSTQSDPHCLSRVHRITRKKAHMEIMYRAVPGTTMAPHLAENAAIFGLKIMSIITLEREYGALLGLQYFDLCEEITRAKPSPLLSYSDERLTPIMRTYGINKAQAKAVKCAIDNDAFTLVQGPPGSGKTKTIVAIAGAILSDTFQQGSTMIHQVQGQNTPPRAPPRKLLVCAPSNAAVDELVMRFKAGVRIASGEDRNVSIVRLGRSDAINANVQDVTLDELVNKKLSGAADRTNARGDTQKLMEEHRQVSEKLRLSRAKLDEAESTNGPTKEMKAEFEMLRRQKALLGQKVDSAKDKEGAQSRQADLNRKKAQQYVLDGAHIICATLSGSGHDMFQNLNIEFETVIIDEAAQCVELSALIPLKYGCAKCILVGDPQQLPPTVFSKEAARFKYEQSLFVRMQLNHPNDVHLLDTQYRMHPEISAFPSQAFYNSRLLDGKDMAVLRKQPWHSTNILSPFRFFDVRGQHQSAPKGHSLINMAEIQVAMQLYKRLTSDFGDCDLNGKVGIITPYKSQLRELKDQFRRCFGQGITESIEFNTTDAFQGRESEVIIFSCVRASPSGGIGFLQDIRRMNVGLTRAKSSLWVLGNSESLMRGEFWSKLVEHAKSSQRYTSGDLQSLLSRSLKPSAPRVSGDAIHTVVEKEATPPAMQVTSVPTKRKLSEDDVNMLTPSTSSQGSSPPDSDVEMAEASSDSSSKQSSSKQSSSPPAGPSEQAKNPDVATLPPRKKRHVDVFMKKKKPRT